jgi:hypothetical protein
MKQIQHPCAYRTFIGTPLRGATFARPIVSIPLNG